MLEAPTLGIIICNAANYFEPARLMAARGAILFVPSNHGLPPARACAGLVDQARNNDIAREVENSIWIVGAEVAGRAGPLVSCGSSGIVVPDGQWCGLLDNRART
jgi:predicted amidohydrolase